MKQQRFYDKISTNLLALKKENTHKTPRFIQGDLSGTAMVEGYGESIILCSNNYLGLANHPYLVQQGSEALAQYGCGASSVRFICGTFDIHRTLEQTVASFVGMEAAISYTSCFAANNAVIPALLEEGDSVISDALNHASIIDGCRLSAKGVKKAVYAHSDMASLEQQLQKASDSNTVLIVTDGVFSMEGDIAKLPEIIALARQYGALVMIDESHATGVIGKTGRGTCEHYGISSGVDIISGTFGKALGGAGGGFIASSAEVCDYLFQKSRPHLFSNSLPPVLCAIAKAAIDYLVEHPEIVASLQEKSIYLRKQLKAVGLTPMEGESAIVPLLIGDTAKAMQLASEMMQAQVFTIGFGFPVVPEGTARIRLQMSDALSYEQIDHAVKVIVAALK